MSTVRSHYVRNMTANKTTKRKIKENNNTCYHPTGQRDIFAVPHNRNDIFNIFKWGHFERRLFVAVDLLETCKTKSSDNSKYCHHNYNIINILVSFYATDTA